MGGTEIPIYGEDGEPLTPHCAAIIDCTVEDLDRVEPVEGFALALYGDDGNDVEWLQYDTLDIALDQAETFVPHSSRSRPPTPHPPDLQTTFLRRPPLGGRARSCSRLEPGPG
jgi:hypothetical protein